MENISIALRHSNTQAGSLSIKCPPFPPSRGERLSTRLARCLHMGRGDGYLWQKVYIRFLTLHLSDTQQTIRDNNLRVIRWSSDIRSLSYLYFAQFILCNIVTGFLAWPSSTHMPINLIDRWGLKQCKDPNRALQCYYYLGFVQKNWVLKPGLH